LDFIPISISSPGFQWPHAIHDSILSPPSYPDQLQDEEDFVAIAADASYSLC